MWWKKFRYSLSRWGHRFGILGEVLRLLLALNQGALLPLMLVLLLIALVLGLISSASFLAPFVYPLF
ncbi:MAG: hypothetical protein AAFR61_16520 [Bacteroidota bacterium]